MAISTQLYRFKIELADISRSVYENLDFRVAQHPSESLDFLLTRVLAYALNYQEGLNFSAEGLHNPDAPCLSVANPFGGELLWIEIGSPSARKIHKASKAAKKVKIYTYKNPSALVEEIKSNDIHRVEDLEVFSLAPAFLEQLAGVLHRDNPWNLTHDEGSLVLSVNGAALSGELLRVTI